MITTRKELGVITILPDGQMNVREDTIIEDDGVEITRVFHRRVLEPDMDASKETNPRLKSVIDTLWTPEVVDSYMTAKEARLDTLRNGVIKEITRDTV